MPLSLVGYTRKRALLRSENSRSLPRGDYIPPTQFLAGLQKSVTQRRMIRELRDRERPADAVITVIHIVYLLIILAPYEVRKNVAVRPSDVTHPGPVVVILARAPHVHHPVHHAGAAENLRFAFDFSRLTRVVTRSENRDDGNRGR